MGQGMTVRQPDKNGLEIGRVLYRKFELSAERTQPVRICRGGERNCRG